MGQKERINNVTDLKSAFPNYEFLKECWEHGIKVPEEEIKNYEIVREVKTPDFLAIRNSKEKKFITSYLRIGSGPNYIVSDRLHIDYNETVLLRKENLVTGITEDYYHRVPDVEDIAEKGELAIIAREDREKRMASRAYTNVSTKYGDFCLLIQEIYPGSDKTKGAYVDVSLFREHVVPSISRSAIDDLTDYVISIRHYKECNRHDYRLGYNKELGNDYYGYYAHYIDVPESNSPLYHCYDYYRVLYPRESVIMQDGNIKLHDFLKNHDMHSKDWEWNEGALAKFENGQHNSKAYVRYAGNYIIITKDENILTVAFRPFFSLPKEQTITITSSTSGQFTKDDLNRAMEIIQSMHFHDELNEFAVDSISSYVKTNIGELGENKLLSLQGQTFDSMLSYIKSHDIATLVDNIIETISDTYNITTNNVLNVITTPDKKEYVPE